MSNTGEIETRPTLARLTDEGFAIQKLLLDPEIEDKEALETALGQVEGAWLTKVENIGNIILNWEGNIDIIKKEEDRVQKLRRALESRIQWLKAYTMDNMIASGDTELQFPLVKVAVASNPPSTEILEESAIPDKYLRLIPSKYEPNRQGMLEDFKTGKVKEDGIPGVRIVTDKKRLVVK